MMASGLYGGDTSAWHRTNRSRTRPRGSCQTTILTGIDELTTSVSYRPIGFHALKYELILASIYWRHCYQSHSGLVSAKGALMCWRHSYIAITLVCFLVMPSGTKGSGWVC